MLRDGYIYVPAKVEEDNDGEEIEEIPESFRNDWKHCEQIKVLHDSVPVAQDDKIDTEDFISSSNILDLQSIRNTNMLEESILVHWKYPPDATSTIRISTLLEPDAMAPLFSGAEWAGTRVWDAAVECIHYLFEYLRNNTFENERPFRMLEGSTVLELGCGLGLPGMVSFLGMRAKHVVLTDQEQILQQLKRNLELNFNAQKDGRKIEARTLAWSRNGVIRLTEDLNFSQGFDYVLNCDCVYEPLYGKSWVALVECIDELLRLNPKATVLSSCERRNHDGVDKFVSAMEESPHVKAVSRVRVKGPVEIYQTIGHGIA